MAPSTNPDLEEALFGQATAQLHDALSDLVEAAKGPLTVRRLAEHRDAVLVDLNDQHYHLRPINRFQLEYARCTAGNRRPVDAVHWHPTTVTAYAGALNRWQLVATFEDRDPLEMYEWMLRVVAQHGGLRI